ncbi:olfactory receptor 8A1-like [Leptodactylus fuscus]|uniref:olfactory receptor 8A1-like n=1 Tax=Leptodactylus fuscus TaxID=238119 RepID=UPI003F4E8B70
MDFNNQFNATWFSIEGLSNLPELRYPVLTIFLCIYLIILFGNLTIFAVVCWNPRLHTPMYMFLMNLSIIDIGYTSNLLPNLLCMFIINNNAISFWGCMSQVYFFVAFACTEILLLAAMAYDRYVAICQPLHYIIVMNVRKSAGLTVTAWSVGFIDASGHLRAISKLSFCASHLIDHFFCDIIPLLKISCSDTSGVEMLNYIEGTILVGTAFLLTLVSYIFIISSIVRIQSTSGRQKAFSTCSSHLTCVCLFYGTLICVYVRPTSSYSPKQDKFISLLYAILVPLLNPLIYSLKNQEIKSSIVKLTSKIKI